MSVVAFLLSVLIGLPWLMLMVVPFLLIASMFGLIPVMHLKNIGREIKDVFREFRLRVLVVDDEPSSLAVVKKVLDEEKCDFNVVSDSFQAAKIMSEDSYDLVILDNNMPGLSGPQALVRADQMRFKNKRSGLGLRSSVTPVVGYSCIDKSKWHLPRLRYFRFIKVISKSISLSLLRKEIRTICGKASRTSRPIATSA